mmetsp:Transcript_39773/g.68655  ORF Transcript_39773/g.68655 Transcript_39773/m.68655 type:complete len:103 (+) Transcript_39773:155-463(+)
MLAIQSQLVHNNAHHIFSCEPTAETSSLLPHFLFFSMCAAKKIINKPELTTMNPTHQYKKMCVRVCVCLLYPSTTQARRSRRAAGAFLAEGAGFSQVDSPVA